MNSKKQIGIVICNYNKSNYVVNCIQSVLESDTDDFDIYVVWCCKTLQNNKALLLTTLSDGMYFECTYNGDKKELYFDAYQKLENRCIKVEG